MLIHSMAPVQLCHDDTLMLSDEIIDGPFEKLSRYKGLAIANNNYVANLFEIINKVKLLRKVS